MHDKLLYFGLGLMVNYPLSHMSIYHHYSNPSILAFFVSNTLLICPSNLNIYCTKFNRDPNKNYCRQRMLDHKQIYNNDTNHSEHHLIDHHNLHHQNQIIPTYIMFQTILSQLLHFHHDPHPAPYLSIQL